MSLGAGLASSVPPLYIVLGAMAGVGVASWAYNQVFYRPQMEGWRQQFADDLQKLKGESALQPQVATTDSKTDAASGELSETYDAITLAEVLQTFQIRGRSLLASLDTVAEMREGSAVRWTWETAIVEWLRNIQLFLFEYGEPAMGRMFISDNLGGEKIMAPFDEWKQFQAQRILDHLAAMDAMIHQFSQ